MQVYEGFRTMKTEQIKLDRKTKELADLIDKVEHDPNCTERERMLIRKIIDIYTTDKRRGIVVYHVHGETMSEDTSKDADTAFWQYLKSKGWGY